MKPRHAADLPAAIVVDSIVAPITGRTRGSHVGRRSLKAVVAAGQEASRYVLVGVAMALAGIALPPASASAHAASVPRLDSPADQYLLTPMMRVTTSTNKHLLLWISAAVSSPAFDPATPVMVEITMSSGPIDKQPYESHAWAFPLGGGSFSAAGGSGMVRVTGKQIGSFGDLSLTFSPRSESADACEDGYGTTYTESIAGSIHFRAARNSRSGWGSVNASIHTNSGSLDANYNCISVNPPWPTCMFGLTWAGPSVTVNGSTWSLSGDAQRPVNATPGLESLQATRTVPFTVQMTHGLRFDLLAEVGPTPSWSGGTMKVKVAAGSKRLFTGSAKLTLVQTDRTYPVDYSCSTADGVWFSSMTPFAGAWRWTNGANHLVAHMGIGGDVSVPNFVGRNSGAGVAITAPISKETNKPNFRRVVSWRSPFRPNTNITRSGRLP